MATLDTIGTITGLLFHAPLANKPKPLPGQTEQDVLANTARIFSYILADIEDDLLKAAVLQHIASEKWFPSAADIRTAAASLVNRADDTPDSYTAWTQVLRIAASGTWGEVSCCDEKGDLVTTARPINVHPMAQQAIDALGGFRELALSNVDDAVSWRARFVAAYEGLQRRKAEDGMMLPAVAGYIEKRRELNGSSVAGLITETAKGLKP